MEKSHNIGNTNLKPNQPPHFFD